MERVREHLDPIDSFVDCLVLGWPTSAVMRLLALLDEVEASEQGARPATPAP